MMRDSHTERAACPLYTAIGVIDGRWKPMLFQRLSWRPHGFGQLRRAMPGVASKVLREQLRQMQADGLVVRRTLSPAHAGVQYRLTAYGPHARAGVRRAVAMAPQSRRNPGVLPGLPNDVNRSLP